MTKVPPNRRKSPFPTKEKPHRTQAMGPNLPGSRGWTLGNGLSGSYGKVPPRNMVPAERPRP